MENKIKEEIDNEITNLRLFCRHNIEANDRLNKIDFLIDEVIEQTQKQATADFIKKIDERKELDKAIFGDVWINAEELKQMLVGK